MTYSDLALPWDAEGVYNSGFVVINPTTECMHLYRMTRDIAKNANVDDQTALNWALQKLKAQNSKFQAEVLDQELYANGQQYIVVGNRSLLRANDPCSFINRTRCPVMVIHNNWILTKEAKIYRFREHLLWLYDGENQYYSSQTRKYLTYTGASAAEDQVTVLRTALTLGHLLERTVILPRFCLTSLILIRTFETFFSNRYRESSFLQHPKVPAVLKHNMINYQLSAYTNRYLLLENKTQTIITSDNVKTLFKNSSFSVINFGVLDGIQVTFSKQATDRTFDRMLREAFRKSDYWQRTSLELL